jgi:predicted MPP superfamily phosphohydrolase
VYRHIERLLHAVRSRRGVLGILGNHDEADMAIAFEQLGVRMLINESTEVEPGLWVIGVDDAHYYGSDDLSESLDPVPPEAFKLLLAHTPELYAEADRADIDLYLCGHTHAGQICFPRLERAPFLNACCPRTFAREDGSMAGPRDSQLRARDAPCWPLRYNCPPEVALIELSH